MKLKTLKPRLQTLSADRLPTLGTSGWRRSDMTTAERGYGARWQRARLVHLQEYPLCEMCQAESRVTAATVVDHRIPHRGDHHLFWDRTNWASLCASHHSSDKQRMERGGAPRQAIAAAGWPGNPPGAGQKSKGGGKP